MTYADNECLFCKFVNKKIETKIIYENEHALAFLDINPAGEQSGHTLVISKKHYENIYDIPEKELEELIKVVKKISIAVKKISEADGVNIIQNNEKAAGQAIQHIHFHIIPRKNNDGIWFDSKRRKLKPLEQTQISQAIEKELKEIIGW
jgi:histidine triad (HIT) family protein